MLLLEEKSMGLIVGLREWSSSRRMRFRTAVDLSKSADMRFVYPSGVDAVLDAPPGVETPGNWRWSVIPVPPTNGDPTLAATPVACRVDAAADDRARGLAATRPEAKTLAGSARLPSNGVGTARGAGELA